MTDDSRSAVVDAENPWLGLASFSEDTRAFFFGRTEEIRELAERIEHRPLTVLYGRSGLGKSSLIQAGVIPRLREEGYLPVLIRLSYAPDERRTLTAQVLAHLRSALEEAGFGEVAAKFSGDESLWELFHDVKKGFARRSDRKIPMPVLVFDQFEEIFTLGSRTADSSNQFLSGLADLVENRPSQELREEIEEDDDLADRFEHSARPCKVLLGLREDFLSYLERWRREMPLLMDNRMELHTLSGPKALEAVYEPGRLRQNGELVSQEVAARIVRFVAGVKPDVPLEEIHTVPPLLSLMCKELNTRRQAADLPRIEAGLFEGKSKDILKNFYEACFADHPPALRHFVEDRLLTASGFRESVALETAEEELAEDSVSRDALLDLVDRRLLTMDEKEGLQRVELTHDVLTGVAAASRDMRHERENEARAQAERDEARKRERRVRRELAKSRRQMAIMAALLAAAAVALMFAYLSSREVRRAWTKVDLLLASEKVDRRDYDEALAYLADALGRRDDRAAASFAAVLMEEGNFPRLILPAPKDEVIYASDFSEDGQRVALAGAGGTVRVLETGTGKILFERKFDSRSWDVSLSGDGRRLISPGGEGVYDVATGDLLRRLVDDDNRLSSVSLNQDGSVAAGTTRDGTVYLWRVDTDEPALTGKRSGFVTVSLSADGKRLALGSQDGLEVLAVSPGGLQQVARHDITEELWILPIDLTPDGQFLASAHGGRAEVFALGATGTGPWPVVYSVDDAGASVFSVSLSCDARLLSLGGWDGVARIHELPTGQPISILSHGESRGRAVRLSPGGDMVATASGVFNVRTSHQPGGIGWNATIGTILLSGNGRVLAVGGRSGNIDLFESVSGQRLITAPLELPGMIRSIAMSEDGRRLAAGTWLRGRDEGVLRIFELDENDSGRVFKDITKPALAALKEPIRSVAASADCNRFVIATGVPGTRKNAVYSYEFATDRLSPAPEMRVSSPAVALSGNGKLAAIAISDAVKGEKPQVSMFRIDGWKQLRAFDSSAAVTRLALNYDASVLAAATVEGIVNLYRTKDSGELEHEFVHESPILGLALDNAGALLATATVNGTVRVFSVADRFLISKSGGDSRANVSLSGDGSLLARSDASRVSIQALPWSEAPPPRWYGDFLEALSGLEVVESKTTRRVAPSRRIKGIREAERRSSFAKDILGKFTAWYLADADKRTSNPLVDGSALREDLTARFLSEKPDRSARQAVQSDLFHPLLPLVEAFLPAKNVSGATNLWLKEYRLNNGLARLPADARLCLDAAKFLEANGARPQAVKACEKALEVDPELEEARELHKRLTTGSASPARPLDGAEAGLPPGTEADEETVLPAKK